MCPLCALAAESSPQPCELSLFHPLLIDKEASARRMATCHGHSASQWELGFQPCQACGSWPRLFLLPRHTEESTLMHTQAALLRLRLFKLLALAAVSFLPRKSHMKGSAKKRTWRAEATLPSVALHGPTHRPPAFHFWCLIWVSGGCRLTLLPSSLWALFHCESLRVWHLGHVGRAAWPGALPARWTLPPPRPALSQHHAHLARARAYSGCHPAYRSPAFPLLCSSSC